MGSFFQFSKQTVVCFVVENIGSDSYRNEPMNSSIQISSQFSKQTVVCFVVENIGVEPMTSCVQGRRSSQLS